VAKLVSARCLYFGFCKRLIEVQQTRGWLSWDLTYSFHSPYGPFSGDDLIGKSLKGLKVKQPNDKA
jgi:hypothetical protein